MVLWATSVYSVFATMHVLASPRVPRYIYVWALEAGDRTDGTRAVGGSTYFQTEDYVIYVGAQWYYLPQ